MSPAIVSLLLAASQAISPGDRPFKLEVKPSRFTETLGETVPVVITLRNIDNQPVKAVKDIDIVLESIQPSGSTQKWELVIHAGETSTSWPCPTSEPGAMKVVARQKNRQLQGGATSIFVRPVPSAKRVLIPLAAAIPVRQSPQPRSRDLSAVMAARRPTIAATAPAPAPPPPAGSDPAKILLQVTNDKMPGFLASGADPALITADYIGDGVAPADIRVWLERTGGDLPTHDNFILIPRGQDHGETKLTATSSGDITVRFAGSTPRYELAAESSFTIHFIPPVFELRLKGPARLSLVDNGDLIAEFVDRTGNPIKTGVPRHVSFLSKSSAYLHLNPAERDVNPDQSNARIALLPTAQGAFVVEADTPGYPPADYEIAVTVVPVVILCLVGGILGGLVGFYTEKGSLAPRVLIGVVAGALLVWLWVFGIVPATSIGVAHNIVSVLFVSLIGGYLGIRVFDWAAKRLGYAA